MTVPQWQGYSNVKVVKYYGGATLEGTVELVRLVQFEC